MTIQALDCQSFAGGFTLAMQQAGFAVTSKVENVGGFGAPMVLSNSGKDRLLPDLVTYQEGEPGTWLKQKKGRGEVRVVFGNPPCSGFSALTGVAYQHNGYSVQTGNDHPINECMWDFVRYAGANQADVAIMESVQLAYTKGRGLMQELRHEMEEITGKRYDLVHLLHSSASVGGSSIRKRYFMVLARRGLKFGIEPPEVGELSSLGDIIYDLEPLKESWGEQRAKRKPRGRYATMLHRPLVDGHHTQPGIDVAACKWIAENERWEAGEFVGDPMRRILKRMKMKDIPSFVRHSTETDRVKNALLGTHPYSPRRWSADKMPYVLTGTGWRDYVHPTLNRNLTFREVARVMGFPDDWSLSSIAEKPRDAMRTRFLGKGITVQCGTWVGGWAKAALEGEPGQWRGEKVGPEEYLIDVTSDYKIRYDEKTGEERDARSKSLVKAMEARTW